MGKVCSLADKFAWYEKLPLAGWKVLVTRPRQHISKTADLLRQKGVEVLELPSICTVPVEDNGRLYEAFEKLDTYQWIIFTSPAGVEIFFDEMDRKEMDVRSLGQAKRQCLQKLYIAVLFFKVVQSELVGEKYKRSIKVVEDKHRPRIKQ